MKAIKDALGFELDYCDDHVVYKRISLKMVVKETRLAEEKIDFDTLKVVNSKPTSWVSIWTSVRGPGPLVRVQRWYM